MRSSTLLLALALVVAAPLRAQQGEPWVTRAPDGRPGPGYWQQKVDYRLQATLEPGERRLRGSGWIVYHNRSPEALGELHWHLYQNLFRADAPGRPRPVDVGLRRVPLTRGITLHALEVEGAPLAREVNGTLMRTPLPRPVAPGDSLRLRVEWEYEIPPHADLRTGSEENAFGMAQWYPQVAVRDDVHGWNTTPYRGVGEFYTEYGDWEVALDVPGSYVVAATGTLQNPEEVLTPRQIRRLGEASPDTVVSVISAAESGEGRPGAVSARRTWRFRAESVRDFAWAASPDFAWDATRTREGVLVNAYYRVGDGEGWLGGAARARRAVEFFAGRLGPYVYPQLSVVSRPVRGMEYPMLAFVDPEASEETLVHEVAHQWYPMMLGSHETRHPFMDEGLATFATALELDDARREAQGGEERQRLRYREYYLLGRSLAGDVSLATHADSARTPLAYQLGAYVKAASVFAMLRESLEPGVLEEALREYHRDWLFRHPYPDDLFRTVERVAGRDLGAFWQGWFRGTTTLDLAMDEVRQRRTPAGWRAEIDLVSRGRASAGARVRVELADGEERDVRVPEGAWEAGRVHTLRLDSLPAQVVRVRIDPERALLDDTESNNGWPLPPSLVVRETRLRHEFMIPALTWDYRALSLYPSLGTNEVDGPEVGFVADLRVGSPEARLQSMLRVGVKSLTPDIWVGYQAPLRTSGVTAAWGTQLTQVDGRIGGDLELQLAERPAGRKADSTVVDRRLWLGLQTVALHSARYLPEWDDWEDGWLTAATARVRLPRPGWWGEGEALLGTELGLPVSDRVYAKVTAEARTRYPLGERTAVLARAFTGFGLGDVPAQTEFYLAQASPWERFSSSRHVRGRGERLRLWGGGAVMGAAPEARSERIVAGNLSLETRRRSVSFELFADAAAPRYGALVGASPWYADAGFGLGVHLPFDIDFRLRFPLWVKDPSRPDGDPWNLRYRTVHGGM